MEVTTKELRIHPEKILEKVRVGASVTVTYRGERLARIVPFDDAESDRPAESIFGLWADHEPTVSVDEAVRAMRERRSFRRSL